MERKIDNSATKGAVIIGDNAAAVQAALTLARMDVAVNLITSSTSFGWDGNNVTAAQAESKCIYLDQRFLKPLFLQAARHPLITLYTSATVDSIKGRRGNFKIKVIQRPRYVNRELCTGCDRCQEECPSKVTSLLQGKKVTHRAIHPPLLEPKAVPSTYVIDKNGFAPCRVACPLGINIQGFVSLLANNKTDKSLALINESAPLAGVLGRVCVHPCEGSCNRDRVDSPVSVRALHRYAADNAPGGIVYERKFPAGSRGEKIAIVGSGPAGLTAAWELTRRGYAPTVFESHSVIGGMLATGIPRFRLPREVREREIEAIKNMGVDIRTGITVGRDVNFAYLKERGYRAFFLSIGTQKNNKLNIPGEKLDGVVDCMSLLLALNLRVETFVGSNIVVIGGGNAAIDSARTGPRIGAKEATIVYRRTRSEMPAAPEEIEAALDEGVSIEYCTIPIEILGDGTKVTGIRCQRTELVEEYGTQKVVPIPGTEFVIDADHVVVAIGQSPDASPLGIEDLAIDEDTGVIKVNPLTLETSIPGMFAGGDCVTGPNNVVDAMAAGLRAAESIDRYIQGRDLESGRTLEPLPTAEVDLNLVDISPSKRAIMPTIGSRKRSSSFEETTIGLSKEAVQREAQRCLSCALCSQCLECTRVCQLGAVCHDDNIRNIELKSHTVLKFVSTGSGNETTDGKPDQKTAKEGIYTIYLDGNGRTTDQLIKSLAVAMSAGIEVKPDREEQDKVPVDIELHTGSEHDHRMLKVSTAGKNTGVFLCNCGGSISSVIDFKAVSRKLLEFPGINKVFEIKQACTEEGAKQIASMITEWQLDSIVLAACRCCNLDQVCYSCTDRRIMCQQYISQYCVLPNNKIPEFINIREQCALAHKDDHKGATRKAVQMILAGIARTMATPRVTPEKAAILPGCLIIGGGAASTAAAEALASKGYQVQLLSRQGTLSDSQEAGKTDSVTDKQLQGKGVIVRPWPTALKLTGSPGNYEAAMEYSSREEYVTVGAVLVDKEELDKGVSPIAGKAGSSGLLGRIMSRNDSSNFFDILSGNMLREITINETAGIFMLSPNGGEAPNSQVLLGMAAAARVAMYLEQKNISPRAIVVNIDSKLCRGCGNCADICPYIELREYDNGAIYAYIDKALCIGCGACVTSCPTGAIKQPFQSNKQINATLRALLRTGRVLSEV